MGSMFSAGNKSNVQPLMCGHAEFGAERLLAKLEEGLEVLHLVPNRWSLGAAVVDPVTDDELGPLLSDLAEMKSRDRWENETYRERQATLSLWLASSGPWEWSDRCGAAWWSILSGMRDHGFVIAPGREQDVMFPSPVFFDALLASSDAVAELTRFLRSCFVSKSDERRRREWLIRRKEQRRTSELQVALERLRAQPPVRVPAEWFRDAQRRRVASLTSGPVVDIRNRRGSRSGRTVERATRARR